MVCVCYSCSLILHRQTLSHPELPKLPFLQHSSIMTPDCLAPGLTPLAVQDSFALTLCYPSRNVGVPAAYCHNLISRNRPNLQEHFMQSEPTAGQYWGKLRYSSYPASKLGHRVWGMETKQRSVLTLCSGAQPCF